jgi:glycerol-3-phosphate dehydrogenase
LTRDYSFEIDHKDNSAPVLTVFGGKLTTHRRLAEHAMQELSRIMSWAKHGVTKAESLPGGDFGTKGMSGYQRELQSRFPWLPLQQIERYVQQYGTRADELLAGASRLEDLGLQFGADLFQREADFLIRTEWAVTADDVMWRRTKVGLRLSSDQAKLLARYMENATGFTPS